jgi:hypothetical protein
MCIIHGQRRPPSCILSPLSQIQQSSTIIASFPAYKRQRRISAGITKSSLVPPPDARSLAKGGTTQLRFGYRPPILAVIVKSWKCCLVPPPDAKSPAKGATRQLLFGYCPNSSPRSKTRHGPRLPTRWTRCGEPSRWQSALSHYAGRSSWKRAHAVRGHNGPYRRARSWMAREVSSSTGCCGSWAW